MSGKRTCRTELTHEQLSERSRNAARQHDPVNQAAELVGTWPSLTADQ